VRVFSSPVALHGNHGDLHVSRIRLVETNIYAAELADFWHRLGAHPKPADVAFYLSGQGSSHDHSRIADLMDASGGLKQAFERSWRDSYTPYRLNTVLGKWDAEFQYWWRLKRRVDQFVESFHDGDALPPLESFSPGN